jgi:hypothetical protein
VVKELAENVLDAAATHVEKAIADSGGNVTILPPHAPKVPPPLQFSFSTASPFLYSGEYETVKAE